jgi:signal transduction histidine kinase
LQSDPRLALPECWYWIRKLQARVYAGQYAAAIEAASNARRLLWTSPSFFEVAEYHFYDALARAGQYEAASAGERPQHLEALAAHHKQLAVWAQSCPDNFQNRAALVGAEIARIEGGDVEAMRLYEEAIRSARQHGFVQNEALAHEMAARFYLARGFETIAHAYLRNARNCYDRWGAFGKLKQLDERYPHLHEERTPTSATATIGAPVGQLDVETVVKASQALSSEIVLHKLIEKLMRIVVEHAGAERGLLILFRGDEPQIEAEATTGHGQAEVNLRRAAVTPSDLPQSALHYVIRTRDRVVLDDASGSSTYSNDEYVRQKHPRSVLCVPIVKQSQLIGALYLENNLTPYAFTPGHIAVLELLASQAAISLENARLYSDLLRSETFLAEGQSISSTGSFGWNVPSGEVYWSEETYKIFEHDRAAKPTLASVLRRFHPDDRDLVRQTLDRASREGTNFDFEHRLLMSDGRVQHIHFIAHATQNSSGNLEFVGAVTDVTGQKEEEAERERLEIQLRQSQKLEAMGTLAGGIAHDFNNILGAILGYGELAQKDAAEGSAARRYLDNVMHAGGRAKSLVDRILAFSRSGVGELGPVNVQAVIEEAIELLATSLAPGVRLDKSLAAGDAAIVGDATQLHQVAMNLCTNALHAMKNGGVLGVALDRMEVAHVRRLSRGDLAPGAYVRLCVSDTGSGIPPQVLERMFDPFFTTKGAGEGTGLGLSLVHGIVADLGGTIDVDTTVGRGTTFTIWLPLAGEMIVPSAKVATALPRGNGQTVMIIDDEKALVALTEEMLAELGYEPVGFNTGKAALAAFRETPQRFDTVLTDETMPELTGTDLAREIRLLRPDIPIVLMSGYSSAPLDERARTAGIREVLRKPLRSKDIAECFGRVLR